MEFTDIDRDDLRDLLSQIGNTHMPFGKFGPNFHPPHGVPIMDLPPEYLNWFKERGFPKGPLGDLMAQVCEIKDIGMDQIFDPLRAHNGGRVNIRKRRPNTDF